MRTLFAFLTCLIGVSLVGQDCEFNSINIEVIWKIARAGHDGPREAAAADLVHADGWDV